MAEGRYADFYNNGAAYSRIVIDSYSADSKRPNAYASFVTQGAKTGATNIVFEGEKELADGKWHHRAIVLSKVDGEDRISLYCDYVRLGGPLPVHRDPNGTINHICRFGQGVSRSLYSSIRLSKGALAPQDFMYASNRAGGVLGDGSWLWALDGARGEAVASAEASRVTLPSDDGQWLFAQPARGLSASVAGEGAATYAEPVFRGRRLLDGADGGRNKASVSLAGAYVAPSLGAPLARLGLAFTCRPRRRAMEWRRFSAPRRQTAIQLGVWRSIRRGRLCCRPDWRTGTSSRGRSRTVGRRGRLGRSRCHAMSCSGA